jgi:hypothetical protein
MLGVLIGAFVKPFNLIFYLFTIYNTNITFYSNNVRIFYNLLLIHHHSKLKNQYFRATQATFYNGINIAKCM